ncbi:GvpL/GvpF family gas vesicle protein [Streptomyces sp. N2-109]|uniref:GvpL/GvpF family gas vesicle protein n=1 Tax=Streptomyces gossypii TaxID=2883101 RepID=A0ABT2JMP6_9ACTN|nr:GvpL/GvpF family gas vesicle protein [Streptomyces gossypii]MCT2588640.1 GvpL/GvpF family gas vesicle protein [Streptomyces gossypii]
MSTYIYAITPAGHPTALDGLAGVGDPPGELRVLRTEALGAVVSEAPEDLRAKRRDLVAHQSVLERLMRDGAVLPMRFGIVGPSDRHVLDSLEEHRDAYVERLKEVDGCLEFNLKVSRDENDLLREVVSESEEIRRLNAVTRQNPAAHAEKVALGELVSREVRVREESAAAEVVKQLAPTARRHSLAEPTTKHFLNVSFLVGRAEAASFSQAVDEEAQRRGEAYTLSLNGPLPPYSFV